MLYIFLITAVSCETIVDVDVPTHEPKLIVTGIVTPDSVWSVTLHRSVSLSQPGSVHEHVVGGALVTIQEQGNESPIVLMYLGNGVYRPTADLRPKAGKQYRLRTEASGLPAINAETTMPTDATVTIVFVEKLRSYFDSDVYGVRICLVDPAGISFYKLGLLNEGRGEFHEGETVYIHREPFLSSDPSLHPSFDESANLSPVDAQLEEEAGEYFYETAIITDRLFDGKAYEFSITVAYAPVFENGVLYLQMSAFGPDYFDYQYTVRYGDPSPFLQPVQLYTNIEGGYGIFAGYTTKTLEIPLDGG